MVENDGQPKHGASGYALVHKDLTLHLPESRWLILSCRTGHDHNTSTWNLSSELKLPFPATLRHFFSLVRKAPVFPLMDRVQDLELQDSPPNSNHTPIKARYTGRGLRWWTLLWHIVVTLLILAHLAAFVNYLRFKVFLYAREHRELVRRPWLILLLICEFIYLISTIVSAVDLLLPPRFRRKPEAPPLQQFPTVDIFLPCCKEATDVPQDSIIAALALDYPKDQFRVVVLDDGGDEQLKTFCEELSLADNRLVYLRRKKIPGVPHNFKCGNLNYGLENSDAEYVVMMDADMILHPSFLKVLLPPLVSDPDVSFSQIPQSFYNLPAGDPLNDACVFGYDRVMVHRDTFGAAPCVGTGAVFRRKHLDEIGGFQPMSITEDTMTAFVLFNHGYKSAYFNRKLQAGLTPWTFEGYIKQRRRWCLGAIQQFSATWRPMLGPKSKLTFILKACYFWHTGYYFLSVVNIVMVLIFITSLALHLNLIVGNSDDSRELIVCLSIFLILWRLSWTAIWVGLPQSIQSRNRDESHFWWMTPYFFKTIWQSIFSYASTFKFTPTSNIDRVAASARLKQRPVMKQVNKLKHVRVHVIYILLVLGLVSYRSWWIANNGGKDCKHDFFVIAVSLFLLSTCAHMLIPIMYVVRPPNFKPSQRRELLQYKDGVAQFAEGDYLPKCHWSVVFYEGISWIMILFWLATLVIIITKKDREWCREGAM